MRDNRERGIAGDCEFVGTQQGMTEEDGPGGRSDDCEHIPPTADRSTAQEEKTLWLLLDEGPHHDDPAQSQLPIRSCHDLRHPKHIV